MVIKGTLCVDGMVRGWCVWVDEGRHFHCGMLRVLLHALCITTTWISSSVVMHTSLNQERGTLNIAFHVAC